MDYLFFFAARTLAHLPQQITGVKIKLDHGRSFANHPWQDPKWRRRKVSKAMLLLGEETGGYRLLLVAQLVPDCEKVLPEHQDRSPLAPFSKCDGHEQCSLDSRQLLGLPPSLNITSTVIIMSGIERLHPSFRECIYHRRTLPYKRINPYQLAL